MNEADGMSGLGESPSRMSKMAPSIDDPAGRSAEIDLIQLLAIIWRGKWFISAVTALCSIVAVGMAIWLPEEYTATAILTPSSVSNSSSLSRLASQFGGIASLAGISLSADTEGSKTVEAIELAKSWDFQERFIRENQLEAAVFASIGWSRGLDQLIFDTNIYDPVKHLWIRKHDTSKGQTAAPSGWELYKEFSRRISIDQDKQTGLVTLAIEFYSPRLAKEWVDKFVHALNQHIQRRDRAEAKRSIEYLQDQMARTDLTEMRVAFSRLIEEQTKTLMLADVSDEYVLKKLVEVKIPEKETFPNKLVICFVGFFGGLILSVFSWLFMEFARGYRARQS